MKILVFMMNHGENESYYHFFSSLTHKTDQLIICDYWIKDYFPLEPLKKCDIEHITLSDGGFDTIPRLSHRQYVDLCGDDIDLIKLNYHTYLTEGLPLNERLFFLESVFYQQLRGFAYRIETFLQTICPDIVIIPHGGEVISKIIISKAIKLKKKFLLYESGFFQDYITLDNVGMHFFPNENQIKNDWNQVKEKSLDNFRLKWLSDFKDQWKKNQLSKYTQITDKHEHEIYKEFLNSFESNTKLLFMPEQVPGDANVHSGLNVFHSLNDFYQKIYSSLPNDWKMIVKSHPKGKAVKRQNTSNIIHVNQISIHEIIQQADAIIIFSSNVGLESLIYGKPVICGGSPYYSGLGFTIDLKSPADFTEALNTSLKWRFNQELFNRFLNYILNNYLINKEDRKTFYERIRLASENKLEYSDIKAPLIQDYPLYVKIYGQLIEKYNELAIKNYLPNEIFQKLCKQSIFKSLNNIVKLEYKNNENTLMSGERQVGVNFHDIEKKHLERYDFASNFIKKQHRVLDLACGIGYGSYLIAEKCGSNIISIDACQDSINFAKNHWITSDIKYACFSVGKFFEVNDDKFDRIITYETVEHLHDVSFLKNLWNCLKDNGLLILSVPHAKTYPLIDNPFHIEHYTIESLMYLFEELEEVEDVFVYSQSDKGIERDIQAGRFLIAILQKKGKNSKELAEQLTKVVFPYSLRSIPKKRTLFYPANLFSTNEAEKKDSEIYINFSKVDCHVVYGPYVKLQQGEYKLSFNFIVEGEPSAVDSDAIILEVVTTKDRFYAREKISGKLFYNDFHKNIINDIYFKHDYPDEELEFRIYIQGHPIKGFLSFLGVEIIDLNDQLKR